MKIILAGDSGVGKTSIFMNYVDDIKVYTHTPTIGVDLKIKNNIYNKQKVVLNIYDIGGLERFRNITSSYYRSCHGAVLVYDVSNYISFCNIDKYYNKIIINQPDCDFVLVANKTDKQRCLCRQEGERYAQSKNMKYIEYNYNMNNVDDIFKYFYEKDKEETTPLLSSSNTKQNCSCNVI